LTIIAQTYNNVRMNSSVRKTFDYIVVGAGSAGCVVAARLSEDPSVTVAIIESGGRDKGWKINVPMGVQDLIVKGQHSWGYHAEPQSHLDGRTIAVPRGKVLGGSSSINAMVYIRGNPRDYDRWVDLGAEGWGWRDVLPYFRRSEDQQRGADEYHGVGGPVGVSDRPNRYPICDDFIEAAKNLGFPWTPDFNGASQDGVGFYQYTVKRGLRITTSRAYLHPAKKRRNLTVITHADVERLLFAGNRATGISVRIGQEVVSLVAEKEVIVSGGTINTPKLLMLSGIGPVSELERIGIPVVADNAQVGRNLKDHLFLRTMYRINEPMSLNSVYHSVAGRVGAALEYAMSRSGPLAYPISPVGIFGRSSAATDRPDLQFYFSNYSYEHATAVPHRFHGVSLAVSHLHPSSIGTVRLRSSDPADAPRIDPNFFATPEDRQAMKEGVRLMEALVDQPTFKRRVTAEIGEPSGSTDASLLAYIRRKAVSVFHPVGTCRMGEDQDAVVDSKLHVRGVRGLRVIDASVMPDLISGNTNAASIMIGEKGADLVREN
jgi:choline dehydrogenase